MRLAIWRSASAHDRRVSESATRRISSHRTGRSRSSPALQALCARSACARDRSPGVSPSKWWKVQPGAGVKPSAAPSRANRASAHRSCATAAPNSQIGQAYRAASKSTAWPRPKCRAVATLMQKGRSRPAAAPAPISLEIPFRDHAGPPKVRAVQCEGPGPAQPPPIPISRFPQENVPRTCSRPASGSPPALPYHPTLRRAGKSSGG